VSISDREAMIIHNHTVPCDACIASVGDKVEACVTVVVKPEDHLQSRSVIFLAARVPSGLTAVDSVVAARPRTRRRK
jgi:hypothetical protein